MTPNPLALVAAALTLASLAHAQAGTPSVCGSAPSSWNAPNGAAVFSKGPGPIDAVLNAVGEFRSHSMLSHGPGGGVSHATMKMPDTNPWPLGCGLPLNADQLRNGFPGVAQINQGGIYSNLAGSTFMAWQRGTGPGNAVAAETIANNMWWNRPIQFGSSDTDSSVAVDFPVFNGTRAPYSLFQFKDLQSSNQPVPSSNGNGMVCATFLAHAHASAGQGIITPFTYSHSQVALAADALFSAVNNSCNSGLDFWARLKLVFCPGYDVCTSAGNQVANCMANQSCDRSDDVAWRNARNDPSSVARSISPDRIGAWGVHWATRDPNNVWALDISHTLQFNQGGAVYGCWH